MVKQGRLAGAGTANDGVASSTVALVEIATLAALLLSFIWLWHGAFPGAGVVVLLLYVGIGLETHLRRHESPEKVGLRLDNLVTALRPALAVAGVTMALALAAGAELGAWAFPPLREWPGGLGWRFVWATAQQYGLLCVFYRRLRELLPGRRLPMVAAGSLFAVFHVPNPFLIVVTVLGGIVACVLYEREPNVFAIALAQALVSFVLGYALPVWLTLQLRVGPQILPLLSHGSG